MNDKLINKYFRNMIDITDENLISSIYQSRSDYYDYKLYQIIDNQLYVKSKFFLDKETRFDASCSIILGILEKFRIPDLEFIHYDGDSLNTEDLIFVASSCHINNNQILLPDWSFKFWPETHLFDYENDTREIIDYAESIGTDLNGWRKKNSKVFYRGSMNNSYRSQYLRSDENYDCKNIPPNGAERGAPNFEIDELNGCSRKFKSNYKYLLHLNGGLDTDYSSAFRFGLFCCSLVVYASKNKCKEWWQDPDFFKENIHYVSVSDPQELDSLIDYYNNNEQESWRIAKSGFDFARKHLTYDNVESFYRDLLVRYSSFIKYNVRKDERSVLIRKK